MTNKMKFDIIIPVATKDIKFIPVVVKYIKCNIIGVENIYIITNITNKKRLTKYIHNSDVKILDEDNIIEDLTFNKISKLLYNKTHETSQTGWYFQQFLKYAFAYSQYANNFYLSWDADTLPINKINFFSYEQPLFTRKIEYHEPYFNTMKKIIGLNRQVNFSFIAEHMLFKTSIVKELIEKIMSSNINGYSWYEKIINACDFQIDKFNLFSEFETYGNFCIKYHKDLYGIRTLNTFRSAGMIKGRQINKHIINKLALDIQIASFELRDAPFPYNIAWLYYRLKNKIRKIFK